MRTYLEARKDRRAFVRRGVAVICLVLGGAAAAAAQTGTMELVNPRSSLEDQFGSSLAVSGDGGTILVGAPTGTIGGLLDVGRAYVYSRQGGPATAELSIPAAQTPKAGDRFGSSVALSADGTVALVGAQDRNNGRGAFETFELQGGTWTWTGEVAGTAANAALFGSALALSADGLTAVVLAPSEFSINSYAGAAYVYTRSPSGPWTPAGHLTALPADQGSMISIALSRDSGTIAAGVQTGCGFDFNCGSVYVFDRDGGAWTRQAHLTASDPIGDMNFGLAISLSADGRTAAFGTYSGWGAYVFERSGSTWTEVQKIRFEVPDFSGQQVALSEDGQSLVVGAASTQPGTGEIDLFTRTATGWVKRLTIPDLVDQQGAAFGKILALSGDGSVAAVTAPFAVRPGAGNFGKAYVVAIAASVVDTPTLGVPGLAALAVLLAAAGAFVLRRRALANPSE